MLMGQFFHTLVFFDGLMHGFIFLMNGSVVCKDSKVGDWGSPNSWKCGFQAEGFSRYMDLLVQPFLRRRLDFLFVSLLLIF